MSITARILQQSQLGQRYIPGSQYVSAMSVLLDSFQKRVLPRQIRSFLGPAKALEHLTQASLAVEQS